MSTTIDSRVVQMTFDNKDFEQKAQTSLSTLDKLTNALKFNKSADSLKTLSDSANKLSFSGLENSVIQVQNQFSALQGVAYSVLYNITNFAISTGKKVVDALVLDPITTGFQEYETQINAVQTILSNTRSKGTTIDDVNRALDELNRYADKTIYNFTEMTRNIGTFTAAGVDLQTATKSIQGIANLAAVSGSTSQQASTAMYQLSQALATGTVKLQDWNSVVNAGMGGEVFQNALKRTAKVMGTDVDALIEKEGSFRDSLTKGEWLTTEVLTETLNQFANVYSKKDLIKKGYTEKEANEILALGEDAENAATKVKTLTQLWDTLTEAAQSGWTQSWELLVGDFYEARDLLTNISDAISEIINAQSEARNTLLRQAFGKSTIDDDTWDWFNKFYELDSKKAMKGLDVVAEKYGMNLEQMIKESGSFKETLKSGWLDRDTFGSLLKYTNGLTETVKNTKEADERQDKLTHTMHKLIHGEYKDGSEMLDILSKKNITASAAYASLSARLAKNDMTLTRLNDKELKKAGYDETQIKNLHLLDEAFRNVDEDQRQIIGTLKYLEKETGRDMLIEGIGNILKTIGDAVKAIGKAYREVFGYMDGYGVYDAIESFRDWSKTFTLSEEAAQHLTDACIPLFTVLKGGTSVLGTILKFSGKALVFIVKMTGNLLNLVHDVMTYVDGIRKAVAASESWQKLTKALSDRLQQFKDGVGTAKDRIKEFGDTLMSLPGVQTLITTFEKLAGVIKNFAVDKISALASALANFISNFNISAPNLDKFTSSIDKLSKKFSDFVSGAIIDKIKGKQDGIKDFSEKFDDTSDHLHKAAEHFGDAKDLLFKTLGDFKEKFGEYIGNISFERFVDTIKVSSLVVLVARILLFVRSLKNLANSGKSITDKVAKVFDNFASAIQTYETQIRVDSIFTIAKAVAILAASMFALSLIPSDKLASVVVDLAALMLVMALIYKIAVEAKSGAADLNEGLSGIEVGLVAFLNGLKEAVDKFLTKIAIGTMVAMLAVAVAILAVVINNLINIPWNKALNGLKILAVLVGILVAAAMAMSKWANKLTIGMGVSVAAMALGIKLLADACIALSKVPMEELRNGVIALVAVMGMMSVVLLASKGNNMISAAAGMLILSVALLAIIAPIEAFARIPWTTFGKGAVMIGILAAGLGLISRIASGSIAGAAAIMVMTLALGLLAPVLITLGLAIGPAVKGIIALAAVIGVLTLGAVAATALSVGFGILISALTGLATAIGIAGLGIMALGAGIALFAIGLNIAGKALPGFAEGMVKFGKIIIQNAGTLVKAAGVIIGGVAVAIAASRGKIGLAVVSVALGIIETVVAYGPTIWNVIKTVLSSIWNFLTADIETKIPALITNIGHAIGQLAMAVWNARGAIITAFGNIFKEALNFVIEVIAKWADGFGVVGKKISGFLRDHKLEIDQIYNAGSGMQAGTDFANGIADGLKGLPTESKEAAEESAKNVEDTFSNIDGSNIDIFKGNFLDSLGGLKDEALNVFDGFPDEIKGYGDLSVDNLEGSFKDFDISSVTNMKGNILNNLSDLPEQTNKIMQQTKSKAASASSGTETKIDTSGATRSIKELNKSFSSLSKTATTNGKAAGESLIKSLSSAITKGGSSVQTKGKDAGKRGAKGAENAKDNFRTSGVQCVNGLLRGLDSKMGSLYSKGVQMANKVNQGYKDHVKQKSPSRVMMQNGKFTAQGLILGIEGMFGSLSKAGKGMADSVVLSVTSLSDRVSQAVDDDIDISPIVTPVLDMTNVDRGLNTLNNSFGERTLALSAATVGGIGAMRGPMIQNGGNSDVVKAIDKLRKDFNGSPRNLTQIGDISYDDDSSISNAISSLVRAARIEGRR